MEENANKLQFLITSNFFIHPQILIFLVFKNSESLLILIANKIFHVTVRLLVYFCNQFVAPKICRSRQTSLQCLSTINMAFNDDKILIKTLYLRGIQQRVWQTNFLKKSWTKHGVNKLLKKLQDIGTDDRQWQTVQRKENSDTFVCLIFQIFC